MMQSEREWKLVFSWKRAAVQLCVAAAAGKFISYAASDLLQLSWLACTLWMLAGSWIANAFSTYGEESLSYFDNQSGMFRPRFRKRSRHQIFGALFAIGIAFAMLGVLVQICS